MSTSHNLKFLEAAETYYICRRKCEVPPLTESNRLAIV